MESPSARTSASPEAFHRSQRKRINSSSTGVAGGVTSDSRDNLLRYSRAVRRLHDRRLAQVTSRRADEESAKRASWHVGTSYPSLWTAASQPAIPDVEEGLEDADADVFLIGRSKYASTQCLARTSTSPLDCISTLSSLHCSPPSSASKSPAGWTPLARKPQFASFWSLSSDECTSCAADSTAELSDTSAQRADDSPAPSPASTPDGAGDIHVTQSGVRVRRRNFTHSRSACVTSSYQQQQRQSVDLERRHSVSTAISWVRVQIDDLRESDRQLAEQMKMMLGSMASLRMELEEETLAAAAAEVDDLDAGRDNDEEE